MGTYIHRPFAYEVSQDYYMQKSVTTPRTTKVMSHTQTRLSMNGQGHSNSLSYILFKLGRVPARMPLAIQDLSLTHFLTLPT